MSIKNVTIEDTCTGCGLCENISPKVFVVVDTAEIMDDADFKANDAGIREAAESCPVEAIKIIE